VVDEPLRVADGESSYTLRNADNFYRGAIPVRTALGSSLNVPAVKALEYAGLQQVYDMARNLGLTTLQDISFYGPAFTLGGADVSLLDMTYAYTAFAGLGEQAGMSSVLGLPAGSRKLDPIAVLKVEDASGKVLWQAKGQKERVIPANAAYLITNILSDDNARVSAFGANSPLKLQSRPAAVKSGSSDNTRDAWAIGYTPQLVTGVWVGNADNRAMPGATSTYTAAPIWNAFMTAAHEGQRATNFPVPEGVVTAPVCAATGQPARPGCQRVVNEVFMAGRAPAGPTQPPATSTPQASPTRSTTPQATPTLPRLSPTAPATRTPALASPTPTQRGGQNPFATPTPRPGQPTQPAATSTRMPSQPTQPLATPTRPPQTATPADDRPGNRGRGRDDD
jgi:membrane peptidoglycan carboxypeptidase